VSGFTPARLRISRTLLAGDLVTQADEFNPKPAVPPGRILGYPLLRGWGIQRGAPALSPRRGEPR
jgi:hypothetical protein